MPSDLTFLPLLPTVVSASSDSLVLAWNPHSADHHDQVTPTQIGRHGDYVRCLATARETHWVASGGFDRKIKLWDIAEGRSTPLGTFSDLQTVKLAATLISFRSRSRITESSSFGVFSRYNAIWIIACSRNSRASDSNLGSSIKEASFEIRRSHRQHSGRSP